MGITPIVMNVLQFWLIDSIVKASVYAFVPESSPRNSTDREPLFNGMEDDDDGEGDVAHTQRRHDIENPAPSGSRPRSFSSRKSSVEEQKLLSSRASTTAPEIEDDLTYPPLPPSSSPSPSRSKSRTPIRRLSSHSPVPKRKRSPPPPLDLRGSTESADASGVRVVPVTGTPLSARKDSQNLGSVSLVTEKSSKDGSEDLGISSTQ